MAQPNMFGVTEFDQDPETAAELMRIRRQQQIADAMMQSGRAAPQGRMAGRIFVPSSPLESLGALAEQYVAKGQMGEAEQGYKKLATDRRAMEDSERSRVMEALIGRPEQPMGPPTPSGEMGVREAVPAGTKEQVMQTMLASKLPDYKKAGLQMMVSGGEKKEAREAAFEQRKFELEENHKNRMTQLQIAKASDAEKAREQRAHQEQMIRLTAGLRQPAAPIQVTDAAGNVKLVDQRGNLIRDLGAVGKPSAGFEKAGLAKKKMGGDLDTAISELEKATAEGGLIDKSTGSGAGALVDMAAGFIGKATPGSIAVGQMKPIFDLVLKMVPRFEGPQSDKDTASYKEAAGELANPNAPNERKKAAGKEILRLMKARKGQFIDKAVEGTEADVPASGGVKVVDW